MGAPTAKPWLIESPLSWTRGPFVEVQGYGALALAEEVTATVVATNRQTVVTARQARDERGLETRQSRRSRARLRQCVLEAGDRFGQRESDEFQHRAGRRMSRSAGSQEGAPGFMARQGLSQLYLESH